MVSTGAGSRTDRRGALVEAACAVIAERGFEGLRTREVAERVGLNHATLHHYFPTKAALIEAVVHHLLGRIDTVRLIPDHAPAPPREALRRHLAAARDQMIAEPEVFLAMTEFFLRAGRDPALAPILARVHAAWTGYLADLLRRGVESGAFAPGIDPDAGAEVIVAFFKGHALPVPDAARLGEAVAQLERWIAGEGGAR